MEPVRLRLVFPRRRRILSKSEEELNRSWFLLNPTIYPTIADVSSHISHIFSLNYSCPHGLSLSMDGFILPPYEASCILKDKDLIRVRRKKRRTSGEIVDEDDVKLIEGDDDVEKNTVCTDLLLLANGELDNEINIYQNEVEEGEVNLVEDLLLVDQSSGENAGSKKRKKSKKLRKAKRGKASAKTADASDGIELTGKEETTEEQHEEFEKETNIYPSEIQEKEDHLTKGSLLVENSAGKEAVPKKRKASEELESPNHRKKKKQAGWLYKFFETDGEAEQNEPCQNINSDREKEKCSMAQQNTETNIHVAQNEPNLCNGLSSEMNVNNIEKVTELENIQEREIAPTYAIGNYEFVEALSTPNISESTGVPHISDETKKISRSTRRQYERRKLRKELKAEAKELLAENVLIRSSIKTIATRSVKNQQHNQSGVVVKPGHIRFELYEKEEDAQKSQVVETSQSIETNSKRKNQKPGNQKYVYCTRSNCKKSGEEVLQVVILEKENSQSDMEFSKLPLLSTCPKEGDVIAYRVLEQAPEIGPILSSFRVGKTLRLDSWAKTLVLTSVEENPVTSKESDTGAPEQQQNKSDIGEWERPKNKSDAWEQQNKSNTGGWEQQNKSNTGAWEQQKNKSDTNAWEQQNKSDTSGWEQQQNKPDTGEWEQQNKSDTGAWDQRKNKSAANAWEQQKKSDTGGWEQQNKSDTGAWEQQNNSIHEENGHIEIDIASLYDVRIVKHTSLPEKEVDKWDSLSQTASLKNSLLTSKREWGKVGPTTASAKQQWAKAGSATTSTKQDWAKANPTTTWPKKEWGKVGSSSKQEWAKADPTTTQSKKEWGKVGPSTTSWSGKPFNKPKKNWGKKGPTRSSWKKDGNNESPNTSSWSSKPFNNGRKEWGKVGPTTNSWKKKGSDVGPSTSSWSSKQFDNEKQPENGH